MQKVNKTDQVNEEKNLAVPRVETKPTSELSAAQEKLNGAVMYALKEGCFFPVPEPRKGASVRELIQWGAMRNLHDAIANFNRVVTSDESGTTTER